MDRINEFAKAVVAAVFAVGAVVAFFVTFDPELVPALAAVVYAVIGVYAVWKKPNASTPVFDEGTAPDEVEG
jgi:hypothetical protein